MCGYAFVAADVHYWRRHTQFPLLFVCPSLLSNEAALVSQSYDFDIGVVPPDVFTC